MKNNPKIFILLVLFLTPFFVGFMHNDAPKTVYRVYLKGKSLGLIESKKELESYIDNEQENIKQKYGVSKVYAPDDLDIEKEITYNNNISTTKEIYEKIKDISPFTISGYTITIKGLDKKDSNGKKIKGKKQVIYVLDKKVFTESVDNTVKSFVTKTDYDAYEKGEQKEIKDTGKIVENIYIENTITIKKQNIPVDKTIYQDTEELSKYLLFGTTKAQQKYTVKEGDTISDVAFNNKISNEEFLIANPEFKDENTLLFPGQQVTLGVIKPQFNVVEEDHVVKRQEKNYTTETRYDNDKLIGTQETLQAGVKGEERVTQKIKKVNGETTAIVTSNTEEITPPITEIIVKGGKESSYNGRYYDNGSGSPIATKGIFGWPASCSSVSSGFGYRWGVLHDGTDIAGCGEGSPIYAAEAGVVVQSSYKYDNGQYITIQHNNGYFTMYAHLCTGCRYVQVGQTVSKGQVIGGMGHTGAATGTHVHFSIWTGYPYRGGRALNAMSFY